mmetsp:Transcript_30273/g.62469  ORF Transcript_30273/g.62469 Transcript_30273/m.62469 type:complete len:206 (+) Transcript_30273:71-688(+)
MYGRGRNDQRRPKSQNPTDTLNYATSSSKDQNCFSALSAEEALEEVEDGTEEARGGDLGLHGRPELRIHAEGTVLEAATGAVQQLADVLAEIVHLASQGISRVLDVGTQRLLLVLRELLQHRLHEAVGEALEGGIELGCEAGGSRSRRTQVLLQLCQGRCQVLLGSLLEVCQCCCGLLLEVGEVINSRLSASCELLSLVMEANGL